MVSNRHFDVNVALSPARRALGLAACARLIVRGLICGAVVAAVLVALHHVGFVVNSPAAPVAALIIGPVIGACFAIARWPSTSDAARAADRHFGLGDRMTTALEFHHSHEAFYMLQRVDAAHSVRGLPLGRVAQGRFGGKREGGLAALSLGALLAAALVGPPSAHGSNKGASYSADQQTGRQTALQIPAIVHTLQRHLSASDRRDPSIARLTAELNQLRQKLLRSGSLGQTLRSISVTQQQLQQLGASLHPVKPAAVAQLNQSLARYLSQHGAAPSRNGTNPAGTARSLSRLAALLAHMKYAQRLALAHALERSANKTSDSRLKNSLRRAAKALARKDTSSASEHLKHAAAVLNQSAHDRHTKAQIRSASHQLDKAKSSASSYHRKLSARPTPGIPNQQNRTSAQRLTNGKKATTDPSSKKKDRSGLRAKVFRSANGQVSGRAERIIAHGRKNATQGGLNDSRGAAKRNVTRAGSLIHGHEGPGTRLLENGPRGGAAHRSQTQYHQLFVQYMQSARTALDRGSLPPAVKVYVQRYFTKISR